MPHPACSRCGMVLVWCSVDGRSVLACPRATCTSYGTPTLPVSVTNPNTLTNDDRR